MAKSKAVAKLKVNDETRHSRSFWGDTLLYLRRDYLTLFGDFHPTHPDIDWLPHATNYRECP